VVVSVGFMIFCLTESLMILSLPSMVHATLVLYLLAACGKVRQQASADGAVAAPATSDMLAGNSASSASTAADELLSSCMLFGTGENDNPVRAT
jgi:hypothetical protein